MRAELERRQRKAQKRANLEMQPRDAAKPQLSNGQRVTLANSCAEIHIALSVTNKIRAGIDSLAGVWWSHSETTAVIGILLTATTWSPAGQPTPDDTFVYVESVADVGRKQ